MPFLQNNAPLDEKYPGLFPLVSQTIRLNHERTMKKPATILSQISVFTVISALAPWAPLATLAHAETGGSAQDLESFLNDLKVQVSSKIPLTTRESPGVVTVVTEEDIRDAGARDLMDVLLLVPGINLGLDTEGVVGISVRGTWAHEGKVQLLWDGHPLQEQLYSTVQLGNRYPVDQIKRIEIIRGPGSAIYGGNAELAVINIISHSGADLNGVRARAQYGHSTDGGLARENISIEAGRKSETYEAKVGAYLGKANRSSRGYTDAYGVTASLNDQAALDPTQVYFNVTYGQFRLSGLYDRYEMTEKDHYGQTLDIGAVSQNFQNSQLLASYDWRLSPAFTLTPIVGVIYTKPWEESEVTPSTPAVTAFKRSDIRATAGVGTSWDISSQVNLTSGVEAYKDFAKDDVGTFSSGSSTVDYTNVALYAQAIAKSDIANPTLGARLEHHSKYGDNFVPRFVLTKAVGPAHFKLLASSAFRVPSIENIDLNSSIRTERTWVFEIEAGYQINKEMAISANVFDITITHPIVYASIGVQDSYANFDQTGSRGFEIDYRYRKKSFGFNAAYSFYSTAGKNYVPYYQVDGDDSRVLGIPMNKATIAGFINPCSRFTLHPSVIWMSERTAMVTDTPPDTVGGTTVQKNLSAALLLNLSARFHDLGLKGLDLGLGLFNIGNNDFQLVQPYRGGHPPLPAFDREWVVDLGYHVSM